MTRYFFRLDWFEQDFVFSFEDTTYQGAYQQALSLFEGEQPLFHSTEPA